MHLKTVAFTGLVALNLANGVFAAPHTGTAATPPAAKPVALPDQTLTITGGDLQITLPGEWQASQGAGCHGGLGLTAMIPIADHPPAGQLAISSHLTIAVTTPTADQSTAAAAVDAAIAVAKEAKPDPMNTKATVSKPVPIKFAGEDALAYTLNWSMKFSDEPKAKSAAMLEKHIILIRNGQLYDVQYDVGGSGLAKDQTRILKALASAKFTTAARAAAATNGEQGSPAKPGAAADAPVTAVDGQTKTVAIDKTDLALTVPADWETQTASCHGGLFYAVLPYQHEFRFTGTEIPASALQVIGDMTIKVEPASADQATLAAAAAASVAVTKAVAAKPDESAHTVSAIAPMTIGGEPAMGYTAQWTQTFDFGQKKPTAKVIEQHAVIIRNGQVYEFISKAGGFNLKRDQAAETQALAAAQWTKSAVAAATTQPAP